MMGGDGRSTQPYGPETLAIRRFLVRLAGLGAHDRALVVQRYNAGVHDPANRLAETALATTIERSDREAARDALSGPLLQLVKRSAASVVTPPETDVLETLDPIAEPALAALLALLVRDVLEAPHFTWLYAPFADCIPLSELTA